MATSLMKGFCLSNICAMIKAPHVYDVTLNARVLINHQIVRGRKRTTRPPPWFMKRNIDHNRYKKELTKENVQFLDDVTLRDYPEKKLKQSPLKHGEIIRNDWTPKTFRTGVLAMKIGVIPQWTQKGKKFYTTLLQVLDNHVIRYTPPEVFTQSPGFKKAWRPIYGSVVVGALSCSPQRFSAGYYGLFKQAGVPPKRKLTRFLVTPDAAVEAGTPLHANHFRVGDYVDVQAKTIGHGFQGVVKRWGFKGGPASHGTTKWHRRPGSIGSGRTGKVWKGKKMPGHMGMDWRFLKGLKIWRINTKYNVLYVHGQAVPGNIHSYVRVYDTVLPLRRKQLVSDPPPMPTFYPDIDTSEPLPEEIYDEGLYNFSEPSITYTDDSK